MEQSTFDLDSRFEALEDMEYEEVVSFSEKLFDTCYVSCLLHGSVDSSTYQNDVLTMVKSLVKNVSGKNYDQASTIYLPPGTNYSIHRDSPDETNALAYFVQTGPREDIYIRTMTKFLGFALSITLLNKLRTQYQLGYAIFVGLRSLKKTVGVHVTIMSGEHSPDDLDSKIDECLIEWYHEFIEEIKKVDFRKEYVNKFVSGLSSANNKMNQAGGSTSLTSDSIGGMAKSKIMKQHQGYWDQIINRSYRFANDITGEDSIDVSIIQTLKVNEFMSFVEKYLLPSSPKRSKVSIMLTTKMSKEERESALKPIRLLFWVRNCSSIIKLRVVP
ncbi:unnamed protein product [Ambrosiozyma monospora]|uniref:Unnamed protein product n=1 Tax=Ambrosiozyma monospora TaxID=43982 RepID=A0A9W6WKP0_AMBMO|nr:unnamed protein product [Ambrosiozyma monospora]